MEFNDELIQIFREEARDILEKIHESFAIWKLSLADKERLAPILRDLHTLKGSARMIGLSNISKYIQQLEDVFQGVHNNTITISDELIRELQYGIDYIDAYLDSYQNKTFTKESHLPFERIKKYLLPSLVSEDIQEIREEGQEPLAPVIKKSEHVRLSLDNLEKISSLATEVNMSRNRAEQNIRSLLDEAAEMTKQFMALREQMKVLQVKADANIKSQLVSFSQGQGPEGFDVLEMDTYSYIQQLARMLTERINILHVRAEKVFNTIHNVESNLASQKRTVKILEETILRSRLISAQQIIPRLERLVRQISHELGKTVRLQCGKIEGDLDRVLLEKLTPLIEHLIRNAIDHGIGTTEERSRQRKNPEGTISFSIYKSGNELNIQLADDGKGIDIEKVKEKAIEKGLWEANEAITLADALRFIFIPGFSTKDQVSPISGQGVGLDVVNAEVNRLGGVIKVDSIRGKGTQFFIRLPMELMLNQILIFTLNEQYFAFPVSYLLALKQFSIEKLQKMVKEEAAIVYNEEDYFLVYLGNVMGKQWNVSSKNKKTLPVILLKSENQCIAVIVDRLIGSWSVVTRPLNSQIRAVREILGASLFEDEKVVLVLDPITIIQRTEKIKKEPMLTAAMAKKVPTILVVDDSVTVREVTARLLQRHHYEPIGVRDGKEALLHMTIHPPDLVLLDLEMPEMDGFEVLKKMRSHPKLKNVPVIVITSRSGEKHRTRAYEMGISGYFVKPYIEEHLLALIKDILHE